MTDNELEQQAKLWHVGSRLNPEKTERLSETLQEALPRVRLRRYGITALMTALLLSSTIGVFRVAGQESPLVHETTIELLNNAFQSCLAPDGTVAFIHATNQTERTLILWKPGKAHSEEFPIPKSIGGQHVYNYMGAVTAFLPDGTIVGNLCNGFFWHDGQWKMLSPLPGYTDVHNLTPTNQGIVGVCDKESQLIFSLSADAGGRNIINPLLETQLTLWRDGKPEPLAVPSERSYTVVQANLQGDILLEDMTDSGHHAVLSQGKLTTLPLQAGKADEENWSAPHRIGKAGMVVGELAQDGVVRGALWQSPSEKPKPLWESSNPFAPVPVECNDIDDKGRVVGAMKSPLREQNSAFLWRDGRYIDLQTLLPRSSRWRLLSANQIAGRTILGHGELNGQPSEYRLTLPRRFE